MASKRELETIRIDEELRSRVRLALAKKYGDKIAQASVISKNRGGFFYIYIAQRRGSELFIHGISDFNGRRQALERWCADLENLN